MVLFAGNLFHEKRPGLRTLCKTTEIFRRYPICPKPVQIQIRSENNFAHGDANFLDEFPAVNGVGKRHNVSRRHDTCISISSFVNHWVLNIICHPPSHKFTDLPTFAIHGNHDAPTDYGRGLVGPLDYQYATRLVNYFGWQKTVDKVEISPILLRKGGTQLALYGMGSLDDGRSNRIMQSNKVKFLILSKGEWFNMLTLHQNRESVHENMIPTRMDLIVWGHKHECLIDLTDSPVGAFRITLPGSSVVMSLTSTFLSACRIPLSSFFNSSKCSLS